jgi:hypothetical protein
VAYSKGDDPSTLAVAVLVYTAIMPATGPASLSDAVCRSL